MDALTDTQRAMLRDLLARRHVGTGKGATSTIRSLVLRGLIVKLRGRWCLTGPGYEEAKKTPP